MLKTDLSPFYHDVLTSLMARYPWLTPDAEILVVCGGPFDREVLQSLGFRNVTISNLDERISQSGVNPFAPYEWSYQDLENLKYEDESFDAVIVHSGLHHLRCPQRGINEMYRVARHGVIGFEPNRNFYTSLGVKLGVGQEYEDAAVYHNECRWGGWPTPTFQIMLSGSTPPTFDVLSRPIARSPVTKSTISTRPESLAGWKASDPKVSPGG